MKQKKRTYYSKNTYVVKYLNNKKVSIVLVGGILILGSLIFLYLEKKNVFTRGSSESTQVSEYKEYIPKNMHPKPKNMISGWKTYDYSPYFAFQYPSNWVRITHGVINHTSVQNSNCNLIPGQVSFVVGMDTMSLYDPGNTFSENDFYNKQIQGKNSGELSNGLGTYTRKITYVSGKKAVENITVWDRASGCNKNIVDVTYDIYVGGANLKYLEVGSSYYSDDISGKEIIDKILSTLSFNF